MTNKITQMVYAVQECVPVILSDQAEFPFQNVIDYTQISIKWPSTRIGSELLEYLSSIPGQIHQYLLLDLLPLWHQTSQTLSILLQRKISRDC